MAGVSIGTGLVSGTDYTTLVSQLMQIEAQPQTLLKNQQTTASAQASALRQVNTAMAQLSSAAQALTGTGMTSARTATSSSTAVTTSATATATPGNSVTFSVTGLATAQTSMSAGTWSSATADVRTGSADANGSPLPGWPLTVLSEDGTTVKGTIAVPDGATLADAAAAINKSGLGLSATVVKLDSGHFTLQVSSTATGQANGFQLRGPAGADGNPTYPFDTTTGAKDATLLLDSGLTASSASNTFSDLMTGVSVTVSQVSTSPVTVAVTNDAKAVTAKVQKLVDAANAALKTISTVTDSSDGSTAALKGNWTLTDLAGQVLSQVSSAINGSSAAAAGLQLDKDGTIDFDADTFSDLLTTDPAKAQAIFGGVTGAGADNVANTPDDTIDVDGIAARLSVLAERASDSATGLITGMANSQDTRVKDLQSQIDDWTTRLKLRQDSLTAQYSALETALGTLKSQGDWLSSQINQLPSWSSSSKS